MPLDLKPDTSRLADCSPASNFLNLFLGFASRFKACLHVLIPGLRLSSGSDKINFGGLAYANNIKQAQESGKKPINHFLHLLIHSFLHIMGFGHEIENDAILMERKEIEFLSKIGISDPYK